MNNHQSIDAISFQVSSSMRELTFIQNEKLRNIAERDLASLNCMKRQGEVLCAIIMAGRVVEAVLKSCFERHSDNQLEEAARKVREQRRADGGFERFSPARSENWSFFHSIAVAGPDGLHILRGRTEKVANTLRHFRNLVHPAMELQEAADSPLRLSDAVSAEALVGMVLEDVRAWIMTR